MFFKYGDWGRRGGLSLLVRMIHLFHGLWLTHNVGPIFLVLGLTQTISDGSMCHEPMSNFVTIQSRSEVAT